jgi:hypothetical protein
MIELKRKSTEKLRLPFAIGIWFVGTDLFRWWSGNISSPDLRIHLVISGSCVILFWLALSSEFIRADETAIYSRCSLWPKRVRWEQVSSVSLQPENKLVRVCGFEQGPIYVLKSKDDKVLLKLDLSFTSQEKREQLLGYIRLQIQ